MIMWTFYKYWERSAKLDLYASWFLSKKLSKWLRLQTLKLSGIYLLFYLIENHNFFFALSAGNCVIVSLEISVCGINNWRYNTKVSFNKDYQTWIQKVVNFLGAVHWWVFNICLDSITNFNGSLTHLWIAIIYCFHFSFNSRQ